MKKYIITGFLILAFLCGIKNLQAKEIKGLPLSNTKSLLRKSAACEPASFQTDLDINNVRTRILNGGDMWWDLNSVAKYEIPKVASDEAIKKNSLFAGAIWIGGLDEGGNLKVAAMTYRQTGSDYFPGPLDTSSATTEKARCKFYDKIFKINRTEIEAYVNGSDEPTEDIRNYPGTGDINFRESRILAPFFNSDGDPLNYSPDAKDYPVLDVTRIDADNKPEDQPDQMLVWVYNDKGNVHSETQGIPIGLEMITTAFAFQTNDEVNNMTFYKTKITNRGQETIKSCYFGQWVDADLGFFNDDYVGCDTTRDLGFCYNGDDNDEGVVGYGLNPPSVGTDFFEGPRDANGNELGISSFMYYNNDFSVLGNPQQAAHYYNYLQAKWKDGSKVTYGGNGYNSSSQLTNFMFPGDPTKPGEWHEKSAGNAPADRRYLQSVGPFDLVNGAVNYVTVGVVWARATSGGATGSLNLLRLASDKAQKLFNNKFKILNGPDAPSIVVVEDDEKIVLNLENTYNKFTEQYIETIKGDKNQDLNYKFQGYMVYQLANGSVSTGELDNIEKARLVFQSDVKDDISQLINLEFDTKVNATIPSLKVEGSNTGLTHSIEITEDLFATSSKALINFKSYYYLVLSYASLTNDNNDPTQFLAGRRNVNVYKATPHKVDPRNGGTSLNGVYGGGPKITRISGNGNGGHSLDLTQETIDEILANNISVKPQYLGGAGPVNIKIVDPTKLPIADFELKIIDTTVNSSTKGGAQLNDTLTTWVLTNKTTNEVVYSDTTLAVTNEQLILKWGIALSVKQGKNPGDPTDPTNGLIEATMEFTDNSKKWLTALADQEYSASSPRMLWTNWIRSGENGRNGNYTKMTTENDYATGGQSLDPFESYEKMLGGRIAPYMVTARTYNVFQQGLSTYGPASEESGIGEVKMDSLVSIDFVLTPDKTKWTKCVVLEMSEDASLASGGIKKHLPRNGLSVGQDFKPDGTGEKGRGWFPGYAIDVESGERLNIMFGEDSYLIENNGGDMIWNPTSNYYNQKTGEVVLGGKHNIYIMGRNTSYNYKGKAYDEGEEYLQMLNSGSIINRRKVFNQALYVMPAMAAAGYNIKNGIPPTEVKIRIRVQKPYITDLVTKETPVYEFTTKDIAPEISVANGKKALDLIGVVPNPYYGYSTYESSQIDNRVKFINLPNKCTIKIFTLNGALVKTFKKDDETTFVDWNLTNNSNVPVASGMYIIHIDAPGIGTKILKWFGVMRQIDLDSF